jgi:hypothetical protein
MLVVAVQGSRARGALPEKSAPRDFIGEPVEAVRRVGGEDFERCHFPNGRRNANETAAVEDEVLNVLELCDRLGQRDDLRPMGWIDLECRRELAPTISDSLFDKFEQVLPSRGRRILHLIMEEQFMPPRPLSGWAHAIAQGSFDSTHPRVFGPNVGIEDRFGTQHSSQPVHHKKGLAGGRPISSWPFRIRIPC